MVIVRDGHFRLVDGRDPRYLQVRSAPPQPHLPRAQRIELRPLSVGPLPGIGDRGLGLGWKARRERLAPHPHRVPLHGEAGVPQIIIYQDVKAVTMPSILPPECRRSRRVVPRQKRLRRHVNQRSRCQPAALATGHQAGGCNPNSSKEAPRAAQQRRHADAGCAWRRRTSRDTVIRTRSRHDEPPASLWTPRVS